MTAKRLRQRSFHVRKDVYFIYGRLIHTSVSQKRSLGTDLTRGPIMSTLLMFAIPIVMTNLVQQLYSMADLVIIGQFVGTAGTVGVNSGGEIADLLAPIAMAFATAGQIFIAQLYGAGDTERVKRTTGTLLGVMGIASVAAAVLTIVLHRPLLNMLKCPQEALGQATSYMIITALGIPFVFGYNAIVGVLRGVGESKWPLVFVLIAATVNIGLDLLLVVVIPMEAAGTAIATVMSQFGAFAASAVYLWANREKFGFRLSLSYFKIDRKILWMLFKLGLPQAVGTIMIRCSVIWINANANSYGMVVAATNSVGMKLQKFMELFVQGINSATSAMSGQNIGAGKTERAGKITLCAIVACLVCACVSCFVCLVFPKTIYGIFINDEAVLEMGVIFLRIMLVHVVTSSILGPLQGLATGCGDVNFNFIIGIFDGMVCKIVLSLLFMKVFDLGYIGLFMGNSFSRVISVAIYVIYYFSGRWRRRKLLINS